MNRTAVALVATLGGFFGYWVVRVLRLGTVHATITLSRDGSGNLSSRTEPHRIQAKKLQQIKWHVEPQGVLGPDDTVQLKFEGVDSPLFGGNPRAKKEGAKLKIRDVPHLRAKEKPFVYKYDVHHVRADGSTVTIEDPEIQIEHI
jgi:hypothetical protein